MLYVMRLFFQILQQSLEDIILWFVMQNINVESLLVKSVEN